MTCRSRGVGDDLPEPSVGLQWCCWWDDLGRRRGERPDEVLHAQALGVQDGRDGLGRNKWGVHRERHRFRFNAFLCFNAFQLPGLGVPLPLGRQLAQGALRGPFLIWTHGGPKSDDCQLAQCQVIPRVAASAWLCHDFTSVRRASVSGCPCLFKPLNPGSTEAGVEHLPVQRCSIEHRLSAWVERPLSGRTGPAKAGRLTGERLSPADWRGAMAPAAPAIV
jgi:hypothetical protein